MHALRLAATTLTALALCACGAASEQEKAQDIAKREEMRKDTETMARASDGSAAKAVGDLMSSPDVQGTLGMSGGKPAATVQSPVAEPATKTLTAVDGDAAATRDISVQAQALATCRTMKAARSGGVMKGLDSTAIAKADADLRENPAALNECQLM
jgi:hypothetical protein